MSSLQALKSQFFDYSILYTSQLAINVASAVSDFLPDPPTPTNKACPNSVVIILWILTICSIADSNNTKFIFPE